MEARKTTTAGVPVWTPAPARPSSPSSSEISEDDWESGDEELSGKEDDFSSQMDQNGIIGLSEALHNVELGEASNSHVEHNAGRYHRLLTPEEQNTSGPKMDTPPSYRLSDHLTITGFPGEDVQTLSSCDDKMGLKAWTGHDQLIRNKDQSIENLSEKDMTKEVGGKKGKSRDSKIKKNDHRSTLGELGAKGGLTQRYSNKGENKKISSIQSCDPLGSQVEPSRVSNYHCPVSESVTAATFPHLLHFTAEEIAAAPGIEDEAFPEMSYSESLSESYSSKMSLRSSPRYPPTSEREEQKGLSKQVMPKTDSLESVKSPDREPRTPGAGTKAAEVHESRKGLLSHRTPDFSKVEPRVRFPKSGYTPPKSTLSSKKESPSSGAPLVFKSPAEIVKEVLLDTTDGSPPSSARNRRPTSGANSTVPNDFRCRRQATTLLEQLQEDYNRLLTKYAEAENTIDRLRLQAKVSLYSDPPKPCHSVQSGLSHDASKFMTLDFPQGQRAEIKAASSSSGPSSHQDPQAKEQPDKILYNQADEFLRQLQSYEDLLKAGKLKPSEHMKGLSQLTEELVSLERGYLLAQDEHKRLQQQGTNISHFDPERELEGLIYECGLHIEEVKEQVEEKRQKQLTLEAPQSSTSHPTLLSVPSEWRENLTHPQTPPVPLLLDAGRAAEVEVSSASEETDEKEAETEDEESMKSFCLKPVTDKHRHVEQDFAILTDHYKQLHKIFDHSQKRRGLCSPSGTRRLPENEEEERYSQNMDVQESLSQRNINSGHQDPPFRTSKQWTIISPSCRSSTQSSTPTVHPSISYRRLAMGKSHSSSLSSLGEITALERESSKPQTVSRRLLFQDGIISPETDSGFVGSESSNKNPAAGPSPLHQGASESVAVRQRGTTEKLQTGPVPAPSAVSSPSDTKPRGHSQLIADQPRRSKQSQRRRTFSCSPQRWVSQTKQTRDHSRTSWFGLDSDSTYSMSEDRQSDQYAESVHSIYSARPSSSPSPNVQYHHGNPLRALASSQATNHNDAIQSLQTEVTSLKERLESCLSDKKPLSSVRASPSAEDTYTPHSTSTSRIRPGDQQQSDVSRGRTAKRSSDEVQELRRASTSAQKREAQPHILTGSQLEASTLKPQTSRWTQTSAAPNKSNDVNSRTHHKQHAAVSLQVSDTGNKPDRSCQAPLCPQCSSDHRGQGQQPVGGDREPPPSSECRHCPVCGRSNTHRSRKPDSHANCQPAEPPDEAVRRRYVAAEAPPALLQCMPMCPAPLLLYSSPIYASPSNSAGTSSGLRGHVEVRGRTKCSLCADTPRSMDSSLSRAIRAARHMKHTSKHMARSLAAGLQFQELLTQSCNY